MKYIKIIFCLFLIFISFYFTINSSFYEGDLLDINNMNTKKIIKNIFLSIGNEKTNNVLNLLKSNNSNEIVINTIDTNSTNKKIEVYLYNSHNREEYKTNIYGITPSVMDVSNMIQNELLKYYVYSYVEKMDVVGEIKKRDLEYYDTYDISRNNIISIRKKYPSINYIFDIHRDSVSGDLSRVKINDKSYAKIMFLVGKKNSNYKYFSFINTDGKKWTIPIRNAGVALEIYQPSSIKGTLLNKFLPVALKLGFAKYLLVGEYVDLIYDQKISELL